MSVSNTYADRRCNVYRIEIFQVCTKHATSTSISVIKACLVPCSYFQKSKAWRASVVISHNHDS